MKQTAVDKFHDAVNDMIARIRPMTSNEAAKIWAECKEMEKEQIIKSNRDGVDMVLDHKPYVTGEEYYEQTYGGNQ
jgi:hypothetical protein